MDATNLDILLQRTRELIAIPSVSADREQCHRALDWVNRQLADSGLLHTAYQYDGFRSSIYATRPTKKAKLILNCHLDVVAAHSHQFDLVERDGKWWGRGTYDMKTAAVIFMMAAQKIGRLAENERPDLQFHFVTDEEIGGHRGSERFSEEGWTADFVVAGEPTDLGICHQAKGVYWVKVHLPGQPGHAARPWLTENPLDKVFRGMHKLRQHFPEADSEVWQTTATPTGFSAGDSHNRVPESAVLKLDIRHLPEESPDNIEKVLLQCFPGASVEVVQRSYSHQSDPNSPQIQRLARIQEQVTGQRPRFFSEHFASDVRYWSRLGVPSICWGPSGGGMHADDEHLDPSSLQVYCQMLDLLMLELG